MKLEKSYAGKNFNYDVFCGECGQKVDIAVEVGEALDEDSMTALICLPCLEKAVALIKAGQ